MGDRGGRLRRQVVGRDLRALGSQLGIPALSPRRLIDTFLLLCRQAGLPAAALRGTGHRSVPIDHFLDGLNEHPGPAVERYVSRRIISTSVA